MVLIIFCLLKDIFCAINALILHSFRYYVGPLKCFYILLIECYCKIAVFAKIPSRQAKGTQGGGLLNEVYGMNVRGRSMK